MTSLFPSRSIFLIFVFVPKNSGDLRISTKMKKNSYLLIKRNAFSFRFVLISFYDFF